MGGGAIIKKRDGGSNKSGVSEIIFSYLMRGTKRY